MQEYKNKSKKSNWNIFNHKNRYKIVLQIMVIKKNNLFNLLNKNHFPRINKLQIWNMRLILYIKSGKAYQKR